MSAHSTVPLLAGAGCGLIGERPMSEARIERWSQPPRAKPITLAHTPGGTDRHRLVYDALMEKQLCDQDRAGACHVSGEGAKEL
jgi:hypothetical protein